VDREEHCAILSALGLSDHKAKAIGRYHEERTVKEAVDTLLPDGAGPGATSLEFRECSIEAIDFKEASFLRWVTAVLRQANFDGIAREDGSRIRRRLATHDLKPEHALVIQGG